MGYILRASIFDSSAIFMELKCYPLPLTVFWALDLNIKSAHNYDTHLKVAWILCIGTFTGFGCYLTSFRCYLLLHACQFSMHTYKTMCILLTHGDPYIVVLYILLLHRVHCIPFFNMHTLSIDAKFLKRICRCPQVYVNISSKKWKQRE